MRTTQGEIEGARAPRVRQPVQGRSRETWRRILDAGVQVLSELGAHGFTVAAVCERAGAAPTAIYARIDSRDDLLYAVYEHGMERVEVLEAGLDPLAERPDPAAAVRALAEPFRVHAGFLRAVILSSAEHRYIADRGVENVGRLRDRFVAASVGASPDEAARERAETIFAAAFAVLGMSVAYGPGYVDGTAPSDVVARLESLASEHLGPRGRRSPDGDEPSAGSRAPSAPRRAP